MGQNLKVGDQLIGPNSTARKIKSITKYYGKYYEIITVNNQKIYTKNKIYLESSSKDYNENIILSINDYINKSKTFKYYHKITSSKLIKFKYSKNILDPYFVGLLLGDGSLSSSICITTMDKEIIEEIYIQAQKLGCYVAITNQKNNKSKIYHFYVKRGCKNKLIKLAKDIGIMYLNSSNKYIPKEYIFNSSITRYNLLAGLIDTDGYNDKNTYDYISKSQNLAKGVCFISRSLGLRASFTTCIKQSQNKTKGIYYRVCISGDTDKIPVRIKRKQCSKRRQVKSQNKFGFKIKKISEKDIFYDITVDNNGLYLNDEFIISV